MTLQYKIVSLQHAYDSFYPEAADYYNPDYDEYSYDCAVYLFDDDKPIRIVGTDGGEPEDQTLNRNWSWVVRELNIALENRPIE